MMDLYLMRKNVRLNECSDEILSRLMGRAKDVVKIALRSDPTLNHIRRPELIYDILKQHFSEVSYSSVPLADFYGTVPKRNECPIDYWVRLNKAADAADECLRRRQGRRMENLSGEVALMFIRNCPDPNLACVFKSRAAEYLDC